MNIIDRILKVICRILSVIFGIMAAISCTACIFGLLIAAHVENSAEVVEQVRAIGLVLIVSFLAGASFATIDKGIR